jgi:hypothetical protein
MGGVVVTGEIRPGPAPTPPRLAPMTAGGFSKCGIPRRHAPDIALFSRGWKDKV